MEGCLIRIEIDDGDSLGRSHRWGKKGSGDKEKVKSDAMEKCDAMRWSAEERWPSDLEKWTVPISSEDWPSAKKENGSRIWNCRSANADGF